MPRGLTAEQKLYAKEVFAELIERYPNQTEIGEKLEIDQSRVSNIRKTGGTSLHVLVAAARLAKRPTEEIARMTGVVASSDAPLRERPPGEHWSDTTAIGTFMLKLAKTPGLETWATLHPEAVTVSELWHGIQAYETSRPYTRSDGQPYAGWNAFFEDLRAGRTGRTVPVAEPGGAEVLEAVEEKQTRGMPKTTRDLSKGRQRSSQVSRIEGLKRARKAR